MSTNSIRDINFIRAQAFPVRVVALWNKSPALVPDNLL